VTCRKHNTFVSPSMSTGVMLGHPLHLTIHCGMNWIEFAAYPPIMNMMTVKGVPGDVVFEFTDNGALSE
jgi:hypothetical protein